MSGWVLDDTDDVGAGAGAGPDLGKAFRAPATRKTAFAFDDDDTLERPELTHESHWTGRANTTTSQSQSRRKRTELVIHDDLDDDLNHGPVPLAEVSTDNNSATSTGTKKIVGEHGGQSQRQSTTTSSDNGKSDLIRSVSTADAPLRSAPGPAAAVAKTSSLMVCSRMTGSSPDQVYAHHLVRQFLLKNQHHDVVKLLDDEKLVDEPTESNQQELAARHAQVVNASECAQAAATAQDDEDAKSLLEQFLAFYNEKQHQRRYRRRVRTTTTSTTSSPVAATATSDTPKVKGSSKSRKKPELTVITAVEADDVVGSTASTDDSDDSGYNRLGHPGHTPKPVAAVGVAALMGEPGSTPRARTSDLLALGIDDTEVVNPPLPAENTDTSMATDDQLSEYALRKKASNRSSKRVQLGEPGSTPTKEYVFFRETPPRFVTETVEAAREVFDQLSNDPAFQQQALQPTERFIELQSSEVSKYRVGQAVRDLGVNRDVHGVVAKIYGSRQCGTSGPGTIVIDTTAEMKTETGTAPGSTSAVPIVQMSKEDEDLMNELIG